MYFCYDNTYTYKDLLYNGQIIKKEEQCNDVYPKDCGTIDTLNQHLCIKNTEKCPLYDVGIGESTDLTSYNYLGYPTELYYNKDGFNYPDKKIIGHLILNDGKPCYGPNEKLWKKFISKEKGKERLKCEMEVFDKLSDDRFKNKGDITYDQIYKDNLSGESYNLLKDELKDNKVSLYMKEFIGIDKTCDEKSNIKIDDYDKLKKNQEMEIKCSISEGSLLFSYSLAILIIIISKRNYSLQYILEQIICYLIIYFLATFIFFICHCVFLGRMIYYNKLYDCSDEITNEIFKILNKDAKTTIIYAAINLGLDGIIVLFTIISILCAIFSDSSKEEEKTKNKQQQIVVVHNIKKIKDGQNNNLNDNNYQNSNPKNDIEGAPADTKEQF